VVPTSAKPDHAGVHVPPPLFYVAAIAAGAGLRRSIPLAIGGGAVRVVAAWAFIALFAAIGGWSFFSFARRRTTIIPNLPATALVVEGPYRWTRNPMYLGLTLLTVGAGLWLNTWWVLILLVAAALAIDRLVIAREEAYLRRRVGADYDAFTSRVRRWI
jgi:protein-S-isoprenylcysteine O-methyltransferase Ste14